MTLKNLNKYKSLDDAMAKAHDTVVKPALRSGNPRVGRVAKNARHSSADPNWITDQDILSAEREMWRNIGLRIELDPYSSDVANTVVRAERYFTKKDNGFAQPHVAEAAHINHPGGTTKRAWAKLIEELRLGNLKRACWIGFSVEQLCLLAEPLDGPRRAASPIPHPMDFTTVMLRKRIDFLKEATLQPGGSPGHGNYITLVNVPRATAEFVWSPYGRVFHGPLAV